MRVLIPIDANAVLAEQQGKESGVAAWPSTTGIPQKRASYSPESLASRKPKLSLQTNVSPAAFDHADGKLPRNGNRRCASESSLVPVSIPAAPRSPMSKTAGKTSVLANLTSSPITQKTEITKADLDQLRGKLDMTSTGLRRHGSEKFLQGYLYGANQTTEPLYQRAAGLAKNILSHDVYRDGNGRTALGAVYKLYEKNGMALSIPPHRLYAAIAVQEDSGAYYEENIKHLTNLLKEHEVHSDHKDAVSYKHAESGIIRLQDMRKNWAQFHRDKPENSDKKKFSGRIWRAQHKNDLTIQADLRRMHQYQAQLCLLGKPARLAAKG